ncbi:MAG: hypothetical protein WBO10_15620 [Pyrinomonadaceae bacterium]
MKTLLSIVLVLTVFVFANPADINAQTSKRLTATPKAFQAFFAKFKTAAIKRDRTAVASMTKFPFKYGWDAGDEGSYNRAQFISNFSRIFDGTGSFFERKNPKFYTESGSFDLTNENDASHYIFEKRGSTYKFTAFIAEP